MNSRATRLWFFPSKNWAAQVSVGRLTRPEAREAGDQLRATASGHYSKTVHGDTSGSELIRCRGLVPIRNSNFITGRFELVNKDELFPQQPDIEARLARDYGSAFGIGGYT